jgi:endonuclease-3
MDPEDPHTGPATYILILEFDRDEEIEVGSLGSVSIKKGIYAYVGSAKSGLWGRAKRHLSDPEKRRWHIDFITKYSTSRKVFFKGHIDGDECRTASKLAGNFSSIIGFGSSDCGCLSHLFHLKDQN